MDKKLGYIPKHKDHEDHCNRGDGFTYFKTAYCEADKAYQQNGHGK